MFKKLALGHQYNLVLTTNNDVFYWGMFDHVFKEEMAKLSEKVIVIC